MEFAKILSKCHNSLLDVITVYQPLPQSTVLRLLVEIFNYFRRGHIFRFFVYLRLNFFFHF